jgi:hypothetical protein
MIMAKGNSGANKAPQPKHVSVFKGIKGLVASGPGMTKAVKHGVIRPESNPVHIDAGNLKKSTSVSATPAGAPKKITTSGHKGVLVPHNPEPAIRRDSASVVKPFKN